MGSGPGVGAVTRQVETLTSGFGVLDDERVQPP